MPSPELGFVEGSPEDIIAMFEEFDASGAPEWVRVREREELLAMQAGPDVRYFCFNTTSRVRFSSGRAGMVELWSWVTEGKRRTLIRSTTDDGGATGEDLSAAIRTMVEALQPFAKRHRVSVSMERGHKVRHL